jgi:hypothetical protein
MGKATIRRGAGVRSGTMVEGLEGRTLMSASLAPFVDTSTVIFGKVTPATILAPKAGSETITLKNPGTTPLTETATITLTPSLDGVNPAPVGYTSSPLTKTVTIRPHGSVPVKVSFNPPSTGLAAGKIHTLVNVAIVNGLVANVSGPAPGTYTLKLPPGPTITPSLIGTYSGLVAGSATTGGGGTLTHELGFKWVITSQTLNSLTGQFVVGTQATTFDTVMTGTEDTTGAVNYTLNFTSTTDPSYIIQFTIKGKILGNGARITGTSKGNLTENLFPHMTGAFKLTRFS